MVFSAWIAAGEEVEKEEWCNAQIEDLGCERKIGLKQNIAVLLFGMNSKLGVVLLFGIKENSWLTVFW